jgi:hypothetical protein
VQGEAVCPTNHREVVVVSVENPDAAGGEPVLAWLSRRSAAFAARGNFPWLRVPGYIGLVSVWGAPVSGASMNPIRSFAPIGVTAAVGFEFILKGKATKADAVAAQGILDEDRQGL